MVVNKEEIFQTIGEHNESLKAFGIKRIGLFGSFSRGEQNESSDIDLIADFIDGKKNYRNFIKATYFLENLFGRKTEFITENSLPVFMKESIKNDLKYIVID